MGTGPEYMDLHGVENATLIQALLYRRIAQQRMLIYPFHSERRGLEQLIIHKSRMHNQKIIHIFLDMAAGL